MIDRLEIAIVLNIVSPYKTLLFNALWELIGNRFMVIFLAERESRRDWDIGLEKIKYPYIIINGGCIEEHCKIHTVKRLLAELAVLNPKLLIIGGYSEPAFWATLVWARYGGKPVILISESHYLDHPRKKIKEFIKRVFVKGCQAALVDGSKHKSYLVGLGMRPDNIYIKLGPGPIDVREYQEEVTNIISRKEQVSAELGISENNFLYVGRLSAEKNLSHLLDAYKKLDTQRCGEWGLVIVGDGPQRDELGEYVKSNHINKVYFAGFREGKELKTYYALSDVFILPSISEPWGYVVNEAMAAGLPVLVSNRCGCYPDLVREGENGFSFDPVNENELHSLLKDCMDGVYDLPLMGTKSSAIIGRYTPERSAQIYKEAINATLPCVSM